MEDYIALDHDPERGTECYGCTGVYQVCVVSQYMY